MDDLYDSAHATGAMVSFNSARVGVYGVFYGVVYGVIYGVVYGVVFLVF